MNVERPWYEFQPKERAAAKKAGMKQYFTGRPCKHGHIAYRCTANGICNDCSSIKQKNAIRKKLETDPDYYKKRYASNADYYKQLAYKYRQNNLDAVREHQKKSNQKRKPQKAAEQVKREARKIKATPPWLTKNDFDLIQDYYKAARQHKEELGIVLSVDHIVPLRNKDVCGLHVPWNLCLRTKSDNSKKHNKLTEAAYWPKQRGILVANSALPWNLRKEKQNANSMAY